MLKFHTVGQIEKKYAFENAVATTDTFNGAFGTVSEGAFTVGATAFKAIMNVEVGDNAGLDTYPIAKGEQLRVVDLAQFEGETIEIYGDELPAEIAVSNALVSDSTGKLIVGSASGNYLKVKRIIPNVKGVEVEVIVGA